MEFQRRILCEWSLQDEALLLDWKKHLERDIETLRAQSNIASIRLVSTVEMLLFTKVNLGIATGTNLVSNKLMARILFLIN